MYFFAVMVANYSRFFFQAHPITADFQAQPIIAE